MDFFLYILAFLGAGVVFVFLFSRLGLGPILGYIAAGIAIGPFGFAWIEESKILHEASELGLVFFLFLIGLELSPKKIWRMRRSVFVLGPAQLLAAGGGLTLLSSVWVSNWTSALIIGFSLALSSTAIGVQILADKNEIASPEGQDALGILILQDLAVIPFLAFLAPRSELSWAMLLKPIAAVVLFILIGIYVIPKLLRYVASIHRQELLVATALLIVVGVGVIMQSVGLSMALGAFLGGALLANSEYRHELQANVEPFKSILFGLFFIALGVGIDLNFLAKVAWPLALATVALLVVKSGLNFLALSVPRLVLKSQALRLAPLLSQAGEFAFVAFGLAVGLHLIDREVGTFCVAVVALSMALTPVWYAFCTWFLRKCQSSKKEKREFDVASENPEVIIAGYGRFGQIIHRILRLHRIPVTVLENNPDHLEFVKKYGTKVFYGDATRLDLLKKAGADTAKLFILAVDSPVASIKAAEILIQNFPSLVIFARARNREHSLRLIHLGIPQDRIVRETLHSSLKMSEEVLAQLGFSFLMAAQTIEQFVEHDKNLLAGQVQYVDNEEELIRFTQRSNIELQKIFDSDVAGQTSQTGT